MPRIAIAGFAHETALGLCVMDTATLPFAKLPAGMRLYGKGPAFEPRA